MNRAGRAFTESCLLHGVLAGAMLALCGILTPPPETIRLDFSLQEQVAVPQVQEPIEHHRAQAPPVVHKSPLERQSVPKPRPQQSKVTAKAAPQTRQPPAAQSQPTATAVEPEAEASPPAATVEPVSAVAGQEQGKASAGAGDRETGAGEAYRRAHFIAIRDAILTHLRYPMIARRQGWSGQVEVAFLIAPDGNVSELRIRTSSGHEVLDEQALAAIRRAAPFAPPRVAALLVMPITFQLN